MKKRALFLLVIPSCAVFLGGCSFEEVKHGAKEVVKKIVYKIDDFFLEDSQQSNVKVAYHL